MDLHTLSDWWPDHWLSCHHEVSYCSFGLVSNFLCLWSHPWLGPVIQSRPTVTSPSNWVSIPRIIWNWTRYHFTSLSLKEEINYFITLWTRYDTLTDHYAKGAMPGSHGSTHMWAAQKNVCLSKKTAKGRLYHNAISTMPYEMELLKINFTIVNFCCTNHIQFLEKFSTEGG